MFDSCLLHSSGQTLLIPVSSRLNKQHVAMFHHRKSGPSLCHCLPPWPLLRSLALLSLCSPQPAPRSGSPGLSSCLQKPFWAPTTGSYPTWMRSQHFPEIRLLGCTLKVYQACPSPAPRPKNKLGTSNRDISGLKLRGSLHVGSRSWSNTPPPLCAAGGQAAGRTWWPSSLFAAWGGYQLGKLISYWCIGMETIKLHPPHQPFDKHWRVLS